MIAEIASEMEQFDRYECMIKVYVDDPSQPIYWLQKTAPASDVSEELKDTWKAQAIILASEPNPTTFSPEIEEA